MHIELKRYSDIPLSKQIVQAISNRIESGLLKKGSKLPSIRQLASILQLSLVTVSKAYGELEKMGLVVCVQGKGSYVYQEETKNEAEENKNLTMWQLAVIDYLPRAQMWRQLHMSATSYEFEFNKACIHPHLLPAEEIAKDIQQVIQYKPDILASYGPFQGDPPLRIALSAYLKEQGTTISEEEILVVNGAQQGIDLVARTFVGPGDIVYMEAPTYTAAIDVFLARGAKILTIPVDEEGMRVDLLTKMCDTSPPRLIYTNPTYHNPTGSVLSVRRRVQLLELAQSYGCLLLEDDPFRDIYFVDNPPPSIKSMDKYGHVIYLKSLCKILSPGCRIAALSASGTILNRLIAAKTTSDLGSPLLTQKALVDFIVSKKMGKHLKKLNRSLKERRDLCLNLLNRFAPSGVTWTKPQGGLSIWISLPAWANTSDLLLEAQKQQIIFLPGSICYAREPEYHHLRLCFSYLDENKLKTGILALCELMQEVLTRKKQPKGTPIL